MISVLLATDTESAVETLSADLASAGFHLLGAVEWRNLVRVALRQMPQLVVGQEAHPLAEVFASLRSLQAAQPLPVLLFSASPDVDQIEQGLAAGVSVHVINGYSIDRLRPLVHLAMARFRHQQGLREELGSLSERFRERKLVDRAKGVLMRARQIPEDEAFRMLRMASMHTNVRVGQVSQQVIDAARFAEAVNRAGQLRMLSQQLVKQAALQLLAADPGEDAQRISELLAKGDQTLTTLAERLSTATYGDLIDAVSRPWKALKAALQPALPARAAARSRQTVVLTAVERIAIIDVLAEELLQQAERLTSQLENAMLAAPLRVINLSGRQRMLSQRMAKQALMARLLSGEAAAAARRDAVQTEAAFAQALIELDAMPLSSRDIRADLIEAGRLWTRMLQVLKGAATADGDAELRATSEALLALFEQLTQRYEHSVQMLMG